MDAATFTNDNMPSTDTFDQLKQAVQASPPSFRLHSQTPFMFDLFDAKPDGDGEQITLSARNLDELADTIGKILREPTMDGTTNPGLHRDGQNFLDLDLQESATVASRLANMGRFFGTMARQTAAVYLFAHWQARQLEIIDAARWAIALRSLWISSSVSLHSVIDLDADETQAMFDSMEPESFVLNSRIKSRADLPNAIELFRGMAVADELDLADAHPGYSWTPSRSTATDYARKRHGQGFGQPILLTAIFKPDHIASVLEVSRLFGQGFDEYLLRPDARPKPMPIERLN